MSDDIAIVDKSAHTSVRSIEPVNLIFKIRGMGVTIDFNQKVTVPDNVLFRNLEGEAVLLHLGSEEYFGLDNVGTDMWQEMTKSATIEEAYEALLVAYDVDATQLRTDMDEFIQDLISAGLIDVA